MSTGRTGAVIRTALAVLLPATLAAALLFAWGEPSRAATASTLIAPGQAIGPARLGMSTRDVGAVLGPSIPVGDGRLRFPRWGVTAAFQRGVAVRLSTDNPQLRTRRGAGVGTRRDEASTLIGDPNLVSTMMRGDTTVLYPFRGIGFVFRAGRAAEVFVVEPIPLRVGPHSTPAASAAAAGQIARSAAATAGAAVAITDLADTVDSATGLFRVTGRVINTGNRPAGSVTVTATFNRTTGDDSWKHQVLPQPLAPGADAPFSLVTFVGAAPVARYTIAAAATSSAGESTVQETRTVPPSEYEELARQNIRVHVELGAPTASARGSVQVFVSLAETGPIPPAWVRDVRVAIPFARGSTDVHLVPGHTVMVLVPPLPQSRGIVLAAPLVVGQQPLALAGSVVGQPQVTGVTLGTP